jgi:hypothetical protein
MRSLFASNLVNTIIDPADAKPAEATTEPEPDHEPMDMDAWRAWAKGASPVGEPAPSTPASQVRAVPAARVPQG